MTDNRKPFGNEPEDLTPTECVICIAIVVAIAAAALGIIGGLIWLCLVLIRG